MSLTEERVIYRQRFQAYQFDFRSKITFTRFDGCEFVKCTLLIDHGTEQLAFGLAHFVIAFNVLGIALAIFGLRCHSQP